MKAEPGNYLTLGRAWRTNDTVEVRIPFQFYLAPVMDQPNVAGVFYGPVPGVAEESAPRPDAVRGRSPTGARACIARRAGMNSLLSR